MTFGKLTGLIVAIPIALLAQGGRGGSSQYPWWENPILTKRLNLSEAQQNQIKAIRDEYRGRMFMMQGAINKSERNLEEIFNEETIDPHKGSDVIDEYVKARATMTKSLSEMSLRMRSVLTPQQWEEARHLPGGRGPGPAGVVPDDHGGGPRHRGGPKAPQGSGPSSTGVN